MNAPRQPSSPSLPIQIPLSDCSVIFVFFFVGGLFFAIGLRDDLFILVAGSRSGLAFCAKFFVGRFLDDRQRRDGGGASAAARRHDRRLIGITLVRAAL